MLQMQQAQPLRSSLPFEPMSVNSHTQLSNANARKLLADDISGALCTHKSVYATEDPTKLSSLSRATDNKLQENEFEPSESDYENMMQRRAMQPQRPAGPKANEYLQEAHFYNMNSAMTKDKIREIDLNSLRVMTLMDTGSDNNIINLQTFNKLNPKPILTNSKTANILYNSKTPLPIRGKFIGELRTRNRTVKSKVLVIESDSTNILSGEAAEALHSIKVIRAITMVEEYPSL
jgi:hypothetical protein